MKSVHRTVGLLLNLLLLLASCSSPDPRLYTLVATNGELVPSPGTVELRRVEVPGYVDRPEIVRSLFDYRIHLAANDRWSEPLGDLVRRVLTADLVRRLPGATVLSDDRPVTASAGTILEISFGRIDSDGAGRVVLEAQVSVRPGAAGSVAMIRTASATVSIKGASTEAYAAAMSDALGQLADVVAAMCRMPP